MIRRRAKCGGRGEDGQVLVGLVGGLAALLVGAVVLGLVARGAGAQDSAQRAADLAALAGARAMHTAYPRLFEPPVIDGAANRAHLEKASYLELGERAAVRVAAANGAPSAVVGFPTAIRSRPSAFTCGCAIASSWPAARCGCGPWRRRSSARAPARSRSATATTGRWPCVRASRCVRTWRWPSTAWPAARGDGVALIISSAYRSDAEQAVLWAQRPDPRWVAPPGTSLHRNGTELDLGPAAAYAWLAANARRFHFLQRYGNDPGTTSRDNPYCRVRGSGP